MALTILLESCDGHVFEVEKSAVLRSVSIAKKLYEQRLNSNNNENHNPRHVMLEEIDGETLKKVVEYCNRHNVPYSTLEDQAVMESLNNFDAQFVNVDQDTLFALIQAAGYLQIKTLMDLTCGTLSKKFKGKNYKEIEEVLENWK